MVSLQPTPRSAVRLMTLSQTSGQVTVPRVRVGITVFCIVALPRDRLGITAREVNEYGEPLPFLLPSSRLPQAVKIRVTTPL